MSDGRVVHDLPDSITWNRLSPKGRVFLDERLVNDLDRIYYRYATVPEAIQLVSDGIITFSDPSVWSDKYEGHGMSQLFGDGEPFEDFSVFAKCFSSAYSSEALWRLFGAKQPVVRYGISLSNLLSRLESVKGLLGGRIFVAEVRYVGPSGVRRSIAKARSSEKLTSKNAVSALFFKRDAFRYERELRVVVVPRNRLSKRPAIALRGFHSDELTRLLVDPYISRWQADVFVKLFKDTLGFPGEVKQSSFDDDVLVA